MKKLQLSVLMSLTLMLSGCAVGGKMYIKASMLDDETDNAMKKNNVQLSLYGNLEEKEELVFTVEQYDEGNEMNDPIILPLAGNLRDYRKMSFIVENDIFEEQQTIVLGPADEMELVILDGLYNSYGGDTLHNGKKQLHLDKPIYLAFWAGSQDGRIFVVPKRAPGVEPLKENGRLFLLKVERKKKAD
ncbi:hypothetical protein NCCP2222_08550 [Sporosarcina sp. NCCP-2222]|uniref:hypothetical protein n=1 Tax=Sporosarcina sp. NCCP-2222 TaxID=2935073 RepID=UPI00207F9499|nr:hypothetical protein [Sporosarcina sp. NCCP-2222]GKV54908.1 hypothetical protein NCCP2222_08550 [Sporosarcina sp. NCCP-2222]